MISGKNKKDQHKKDQASSPTSKLVVLRLLLVLNTAVSTAKVTSPASVSPLTLHR
jgi:hypothetical protein